MKQRNWNYEKFLDKNIKIKNSFYVEIYKDNMDS